MRFEGSIPNFSGKSLRILMADAQQRLIPAFSRLAKFRSREHYALRAMVMAFSITILITGSVRAQRKNAGQQPSDFTNLSLDDVMNLEVASVSKHEQRLSGE